MLTGYVGTYSSPDSEGVYRFGFDPESGTLSGPQLYCGAVDAKWVSLRDNRLVFPIKEPSGTGIRVVDDFREVAQATNSEDSDTPCYIQQSAGGYIFTANYHQGAVTVYRLLPNPGDHEPISAAGDGVRVGLETATTYSPWAEPGIEFSVLKRLELGNEAGCHQILLHDDYLMVPCLQQHKIRIFDRTANYAEVATIVFPHGSGPRHGVFNFEHTKLYVVSEWSNQLFVFDVDGLDFQLRQVLDLLPEGAGDYATRNGPDESAAAAAIRLSRDERFLYISVRFRDELIVLDVGGAEARIVQRTSCGGEHPRDFILSPDERHVIVANRTRGGIVAFARDKEDGQIGAEMGRIPLAEGVSLAWELE